MANQHTSLRARQNKFTYEVALLILEAHKMGYEVSFGEAWRPQFVAEIYEKQGIGKKNSVHCARLAIDLNLFSGGKLLKETEEHASLGAYWESRGMIWGGRFAKPDGNHYEMGA